MNFFKLYVGDYQRDTAHLSITEHGAYMLMLQHYYATEKPLPTGKALHRMLRVQDKAERDAIDAVASQFWRETPEGLVNDRADAEIRKATAQAETNARIARDREAQRKATRTDNEPSTNRDVDKSGAAPEPTKVSAEKSLKNTTFGEFDAAQHNGSRNAQVVDSSSTGSHESCTNRATNDQPNQTPDTRHQTSRGVVGHQQAGPPATPPPPVLPSPSPRAAQLPPDQPTPESPGAAVCKALRARGIAANPTHPDLVALLAEGATLAEFSDAATDCVSRGKANFAYLLATVRGRRREALGSGVTGALPSPQDDAERAAQARIAETQALLRKQDEQRRQAVPPPSRRTVGAVIGGVVKPMQVAA